MIVEKGLPNLQQERRYAESPELRESVRVTQVGILALLHVYEEHKNLGEVGKRVIPHSEYASRGITNGHDSKVLEADWRAEKKIIGVLDEFAPNVQTRGEETGDRGFDNPRVEATGVFDGLDGSLRYLEGGGNYGTMLSILKGKDPQYNDYMFSGIVDPINHQIIFATNGLGAYRLDLEDGGIERIHTDQKLTHLEPDTRLFADLKFDEVYGKTVITDLIADKFKMLKKKPRTSGSSAANFIDMADGKKRQKRWQFWKQNPSGSIDCQRKKNLENLVAYGIMREAGGVMVTVDDNEQVVDLGEQSYLSFAQEPEDHRPVITGVNVHVTDAITSELGLSRPGEVIQIFSRADHQHQAA